MTGPTYVSPPWERDRTSAFLNVRVADIGTVHEEWSSRGAEFLAPPVDHGVEIRAYIRDPDGQIVVGQTAGLQDSSE